MTLPDTMPDGCNFLGLLRTALSPAAVAGRFVAAGWSVAAPDGVTRLENAWGQLTLTAGSPMALQGWLDRPNDRLRDVLAPLEGREIEGVYQWITPEGNLWREMPFDESLLDPDDPRLPADIKESVRASIARDGPIVKRRRPWWKFW